MGTLGAALRGWWAAAAGYQRLAYLVGAGLLLVGLAHAGLWALAGGPAAGALSWRKPTTFGLSFGLTTVTLAWVGTWLPVRPAVGWTAAGLLCAATTYEVAWVSVQHARGVPAHFNDTTPLDERLFIAGAVMVAVAIVVIAAMTLAAFVRISPRRRWRWRSGRGWWGCWPPRPPGCGCSCMAWRWWTPTPTRPPSR